VENGKERGIGKGKENGKEIVTEILKGMIILLGMLTTLLGPLKEIQPSIQTNSKETHSRNERGMRSQRDSVNLAKRRKLELLVLRMMQEILVHFPDFLCRRLRWEVEEQELILTGIVGIKIHTKTCQVTLTRIRITRIPEPPLATINRGISRIRFIMDNPLLILRISLRIILHISEVQEVMLLGSQKFHHIQVTELTVVVILLIVIVLTVPITVGMPPMLPTLAIITREQNTANIDTPTYSSPLLLQIIWDQSGVVENSAQFGALIRMMQELLEAPLTITCEERLH